jgi:hypothetical protein
MVSAAEHELILTIANFIVLPYAVLMLRASNTFRREIACLPWNAFAIA